MQEPGEQLQNRKDQLEAKIRINKLRQTLEAIRKAQGENYPHHMKSLLIENLMGLAWGAIPEYVSALNLGDGIKLDRSPKDLAHVPSRSQQVWDLERVDQHGAYLSQSLGEQWQPIFPPKE